MILIIVAAVVIAGLLYYFFKKDSFAGKDLKQDYIKKDDPQAQGNYEKEGLPKNRLTKDEKLELSWQFLYDITDTVLNKFSKEDREEVHKIGHKMLDVGAGYEHVIEYGLKQDQDKEHATELEQEKEKMKDKTQSV